MDQQLIRPDSQARPRVASMAAEPEYYYLSGRLPSARIVYLLPVRVAYCPLPQIIDNIHAQQFDVVVWSKIPPTARTATYFAAMLSTLERDYHAAPTSAPSIIIVRRKAFRVSAERGC